MDRFAIIIPYFGKFRQSINLFLESCRRNPQIDWLFYTDCPWPSTEPVPSNIKWTSTTLEATKALAEEKLQVPVNLERPYKLCDLRPLFGKVYEDDIREYSWWGYGDTDVINGDIRGFLDKIDYCQWDKINCWGHLTLVRNNHECNKAYRTEVPGTMNWMDILTTENNVGFDEHDFNPKFLASGKKIYEGLWSADIDIFYKRMRCVDIKTVRCFCKVKIPRFAPKNYAYQLFAIIDGKAYRFYVGTDGNVCREEFAYIHFREEAPINLSSMSEDTFIISRHGFYPVEDRDSLCDPAKFKALVGTMNLQERWPKETARFIFHLLRNL